jgi:hypothetical protein
MSTKLHFWRRAEGDIGRESREPCPLARLDDGRYARYHMACPDFERGLECQRAGLWHWDYLGGGVIHTMDGVAQYPGPERRKAR